MAHLHWYNYAIYVMVATQISSWIWFSTRAGQLSDRKFLLFSAMMMTGMVGATIECALGRTWGTMAVQIVFFVFTAYGGWKRYRQLRARARRVETAG